MAATLMRRLPGLLRFSASACTRTTRVSQLSTLIQTPHLCTSPRAAASALHRPAVCLNILQRVRDLIPPVTQQPIRTLTYVSLKKGKRKSVKSVTQRFMRLHSGLWIRRQAGYKKKLWQKSLARKRRLRQHVFCNKTQSKMLDKMTGKYWKRRNWYVDDPYLKYHDRVNLKL
ncbi:39S ribosomal protein L35, mitochondrial [Synchiropus splendidus]|uniref:39S ribosomal protein L35, mitochondrial n=1 Tax=Synchiropus splendidus TaxID=270530 RepID=UPI00237DCFE8|nr:39S ribosomal protein L35, mitochondrial [Synchiropus splendidus]